MQRVLKRPAEWRATVHVPSFAGSRSCRQQGFDGLLVPAARSVRCRDHTTTVNRVCAGTVCLKYQRDRGRMSILGRKVDWRFSQRGSTRRRRALAKQQGNNSFVSILRGKVQGGPSPAILCRASCGCNQLRDRVNLSPELEQRQAQWCKAAIGSYDAKHNPFQGDGAMAVSIAVNMYKHKSFQGEPMAVRIAVKMSRTHMQRQQSSIVGGLDEPTGRGSSQQLPTDDLIAVEYRSMQSRYGGATHLESYLKTYASCHGV
jgi:hypothetical protein